MKQKALYVFVMSWLITVMGISQTVRIKGKMTGTPEGQKISISRVDGAQITGLDTLNVDSKGNFQFETKLKEATLLVMQPIVSSGNAPILHMMVEPKENIEISIDFDNRFNYMHITEAKGSRNVIVYQKYNDVFYRTGLEMATLEEEYVNPATSDNRKKEIEVQAQALQSKQGEEVYNIIKENKDVLVSALLVTYFENDFESFSDLYEEVETNLTKRYASNQFVKHLTDKLSKMIRIGKMAPEISMKDADGNERKLSDLRGKVVLIDFWASWCRPCRMENPNVVRIYDTYNAKGFEVYSVSLDKSREEWLRAIAADNLKWKNHVSDLAGWKSSGGATYGVTSIPSTVLIDREGKVVARNLRGSELEQKVRELVETK